VAPLAGGAGITPPVELSWTTLVLAGAAALPAA
jgi:hypothetical protein